MMFCYIPINEKSCHPMPPTFFCLAFEPHLTFQTQKHFLIPFLPSNQGINYANPTQLITPRSQLM